MFEQADRVLKQRMASSINSLCDVRKSRPLSLASKRTADAMRHWKMVLDESDDSVGNLNAIEAVGTGRFPTPNLATGEPVPTNQ